MQGNPILPILSRIVKLSKKSILKYTTLTLVSPLCLLILLIAALYLPPVQKWAVGVVSDYASKETGMQISIDRVLLSFPLDMSLEGVKCIKTDSVTNLPDTIMAIDKAVAGVRLMPLFKKNIEVSELELLGAKLNTSDFVPQARIKGVVGRIAMEGSEPVGKINFAKSDVDLQKIILDNAHLDIQLSDTVIEDTTTSKNDWHIMAQEVAVTNSEMLLHMPGDTLQVGAKIKDLRANEINLNLLDEEYNVGKLNVCDALITYDNVFEKRINTGLDFNHMAFDISRLNVESIAYKQPNLNLAIKECSLKEQCGFAITSLKADIALNESHLSINGNVNTPSSYLTTDSKIDLTAFDGDDKGKIHSIIDASLSRTDLMLVAGNSLPRNVKNVWPAYPLNIKGEVLGNMNAVNVPGLKIEIPSVISADLNGNVRGFMSLADNIYSKDFQASMHVDARTYNMSFVKAFMDRNTAKMINIPNIHAVADIDVDGANYDVRLRANENKGTVAVNAKVNAQSMAYDAKLKANNLKLNHFVKGMGLGTFSGNINAKGKGFDYTDKKTQCNLTADIRQIQYGKYNLSSLKAKANIANGLADVKLNSNNKYINGDVNLSALLNSKNIKATIATELTNVDLYRLYMVDVPLKFALCGHIDVETDMNQFYKVSGMVSDIRITDSAGLHSLEDIVLDVYTRRDTTAAHIYCGDFETRLQAQGGYKWLLGCTERLSAAIGKQYKERTINQEELRAALPKMSVYLHCGQENPIYKSIKYWDVDFREINANIKTSREDGINGDLYLYGLQTMDYKIDTISANIKSSNDPLDISYKAHIQNTKPNDYVFDVFLDGNVLEHGISLNGAFYDENNKLGLKLGAEATMEDKGIKVHLTPKKPVIAYEEFELNDSNYIILGEKNRIYADVRMKAADGTGIQVYSTDEDSDAMQDLTLSLNHLNIGKLLAAIPYAPKVDGMLYGDYHFIQENDESFSVSTDMTVHNMVYEGCNIGNLGTQMVYMPKDDGSHYVDGHILLDDEEVGSISGTYNFDNDAINAKMEFMHFPMELVNGFVPDQIIGLEGFAEGELAIQGTTSKPNVEGELFLESASLISVPYGVRMRFDDDPVRIENSRLLFENFQMYASNNEPLIAQGYLDFSDTDHMKLNLRMKAENFMLIDAKENRNSEAYGKAYVNFYCFIQGELDKLKVRGKLDVLSSTNLYYVLKDSPITTDNRLKELVTFVDFSNGEQMVVSRPTIDGMEVDLSITVNDGAHVKCWLNTDHSNYLDLIGGGDLRMKYVNEEINLRGRYTIHEGEMKYSLPIIPLKTFTISPESYVEFTGDMMNPKLSITATERTKSSCNIDGVNRLVIFDCGVVITKTLKDMGLQFIIDAPEEQTIKDQLAMMSSEERGKIAVTMLTTGMYLADGNTSDFSMNSALNSFLQSEINHIAGNALKTLDLSFGLDNSTEEDGTMHTDYTFKFAKRFWNNKLSISIGGKISSGPDVSGQNKSFFDNVEAQYRFSETSNQYMNLFYKRSVYDYLEGYVGQYGAGYMYKKKLQHLGDLFKNTPVVVSPTPRSGQVPGSVRYNINNDSTSSK